MNWHGPSGAPVVIGVILFYNDPLGALFQYGGKELSKMKSVESSPRQALTVSPLYFPAWSSQYYFQLLKSVYLGL